MMNDFSKDTLFAKSLTCALLNQISKH